MRIKLGDGSSLDLKPSTPSKRSVKNKSGSLKRHNSQQALRRVGGYSNAVTAIGQPADTPLCYVRSTTASDAKLPVVVREQLRVRLSEKEFTMDLGGSTWTGYRGGRGV